MRLLVILLFSVLSISSAQIDDEVELDAESLGKYTTTTSSVTESSTEFDITLLLVLIGCGVAVIIFVICCIVLIVINLRSSDPGLQRGLEVLYDNPAVTYDVPYGRVSDYGTTSRPVYVKASQSSAIYDRPAQYSVLNRPQNSEYVQRIVK